MDSLAQKLVKAVKTPDYEEIQKVRWELASKSEEGAKLVEQYTHVKDDLHKLELHQQALYDVQREIKIGPVMIASDNLYHKVEHFKNKLFNEKCEETRIYLEAEEGEEEREVILDERIMRIRYGLNSQEIENLRIELMKNDTEGAALLKEYDDKRAQYECMKREDQRLKKRNEELFAVIREEASKANVLYEKIMEIGKELLEKELQKN